jgi:hypothetical protein
MKTASMIDVGAPEAMHETRAEPDLEPAPDGRAAHLARLIRKLTGVREELLARIPAERTRYTALAAVMTCTASIGGLSMFFALSEILGTPEPWFWFLAAFWATFILCIDCWLVSSTAGTRWRTRVAVLLPRLAIAAVFGIVIAEPLILRVFQTGIVTHVQHERQAAIDTLRSALVDCNPVPGIPQPSRSRGCAGMILSISSPAAASQSRLTALQTQETALQTQVSTETAQLSRKQSIVNDECNGTSGSGLTGIPGNGPACKQDQRYVAVYLATHPIESQENRVAALNNQITALKASLAGQQARDRAAISAAIASRLRRETPPGAPVGMAERFQSLSYLSRSNAFIAVASWFLRVFFILIDCLPVLVKFISGSTPYDRLVDTEVSAAERRFSRDADTRGTIADGRNETTMFQARAEEARRRKEIDLDILQQDAARDTVKEDSVDALWRSKLNARRSAAASTGSPGWSRDDQDQAAIPLNGTAVGFGHAARDPSG